MLWVAYGLRFIWLMVIQIFQKWFLEKLLKLIELNQFPTSTKYGYGYVMICHKSAKDKPTIKIPFIFDVS